MNSIFGNNIKTIEFDALIIGGGGSGMRASLELAKSGLNTAVVSKVFRQGLIQFLLKAVLHVLLQVLTQMMIGDGICMTQLKVQILLEIRMQ